MKPFYSLVGLALLAVASAQHGNYLDEEDFDLPLPPRPAYRPPTRPSATPAPAAPKPTPVPILKQINRHNEDGSYTYGYEGADGSFKIETKLTTGEVMGKYGYVDDTGKVRVVEYGANKYGFMPAGEGITVAPPTLVDETTDDDIIEERRPRPQQQSKLYLEDDRVVYDEAPRPAPRPRPVFSPEPAPRSSYKPAAPAPAYRPPPPQPQPQPAYRPQQLPSSAPVPPRAQIAGAAPVHLPTPVVTRPRPAPVYEEPRPSPKAYRPPPQQPAYRPQPAPQPAPARANYARTGPSILDQLERDYALPPSGQSYHDVSFSSF